MEVRQHDVCGADNCDSTYWTQNDDGTETCENGHTRQRYQRDAEGEDYHVFGQTTRRRVEKVNRAPLVPKGKAQANLLLLAHQHILRLQVWWLIHEKHFPKDYEILVQELWSQRVNILADKIDDTTISSYEMPAPVSDTEDERRQEQEHRTIKLEQLPGVEQTLGLCYMAAYIMRIPVFVGDFVRWAMQKRLPYLGAYSLLPAEMRSRLGLTSKSMLRDAHLSARLLQFRTHALIMAYQRTLSFQMPKLNLSLCLYRAIEWLALPLEVYIAVKTIASLMGQQFAYAKLGSSLWLRRTPDKQLAAYIVVAVKILYPWDGLKRSPFTISEMGAIEMDWNKWRKALAERDSQMQDDSFMTHEQAKSLTENQILQMPAAQVDQYMDWFQREWAEAGEEQALLPKKHAEQSFKYEQDMFRLFPLPDTNHTQPIVPAKETRTAVLQNIAQVQSNLSLTTPSALTEEEHRRITSGRPGTKHAMYRDLDAMNDIGQEVCEAVAAFIGMTPTQVAKCASSVEIKLQQWVINEQRKKQRS